MIVLVMGVSGSGKSSVGLEVARRLGWRFVEADDFHPPASVAKMSRGIPLTDHDRASWLHALRDEIASADDQGDSLVVACSALKRAYRDILLGGVRESLVVHLRGTYDLLLDRMARRQHFMPPALLRTQFEVLEPPDDPALILDVSRPVDDLAAEVTEHVRELQSRGAEQAAEPDL